VQQRLLRVGAMAGRVEFLLNELRRRRVFRVLAGYLALTFASAAARRPGLSGALVSRIGRSPATVALTAILFVPTLILAWIYDITSEGLRRTPPADATSDTPDTSACRLHRRAAVQEPHDRRGARVLQRRHHRGHHCPCQLHCGAEGDLATSVMQYKGTTEGAGAIARSLGVTHILEGSVRQAAGRVRIVAQLIDARTDEHRWAETYDRDLEDIFAIQSDVANRVARALEARLTTGARARLAQRPTTDMDAYDLYLRGRFAWNRRTAEALQESVRLLRRATELDPGYAVAWAALADSHIMLAIHGAVAPAESLMPARAAAARALDLDPELAEALNARACVAALSDFDFAAAEQDFAAAIRGNPQYATAYQWQAMHLHAPLARFADGRRALDTAREIDPLSPAIRVSGGVLAYYERRFDAAVEAVRRGADHVAILRLRLVHHGTRPAGRRRHQRRTGRTAAGARAFTWQRRRSSRHWPSPVPPRATGRAPASAWSRWRRNRGSAGCRR
jgi:tetratricopeptide (TPR) repeat protein